MITEYDSEDKCVKSSYKAIRDWREPQNYQVLGPLSLCIDQDTSHPGCIIIDLLLPKLTNVEEIVFKNYYTAYVSVQMRFHPPISSNYDKGTQNLAKGSYPLPCSKGWQMVLPQHIIMKNPNLEYGSHDLVSLSPNEKNQWSNVIAIRLILRQPSPMWNNFKIENLKIYNQERMQTITTHNHNIGEDLFCLQQNYLPLLKMVKDKTLYMMNRDFDVSWTRSEYEFYQIH